jgi:murein L,D-transpeptidase YcbB/YkuD
VSRRLELLVGLVIAIGPVYQSCLSLVSGSDQNVRRLVREEIGRRSPASSVGADALTTTRMRQFYQSRGYAPVWVNDSGPRASADRVAEALAGSREHGLRSEDYGIARIRSLLDEARRDLLEVKTPVDASQLAELELALTRGYLRYSEDLSRGRLRPRDSRSDARLEVPAALDAAVRGEPPATALGQLAPRHTGYQKLRDLLALYREVEAHGGWDPLPANLKVIPGTRGPQVIALRERLAVTGDLERTATEAPTFDPNLERAVRRFQARHGLSVTGRIGAADVAALNVPVQERIRQIEVNLERWRWLPSNLGSTNVAVNIPDYTLAVNEGDRPALSMKVVVGDEYSPTPVLSDELTYIVFGPSWSIPVSITKEEILPKVKEDPGYLAAHDMRAYAGEGGDARDVTDEIDWGSVDPENLSFTLRQAPGPRNPLGRIKFICPNRFNVYLHDTPAEHLFARRERTFSHGCIRVEKPSELAAFLLRDQPEWTVERIQKEMETAKEKTVTLSRPVPVHIFYWTAWVDDAGLLQFRDDPYGFDREVAAALDGAPRSAHASAPVSRGAQALAKTVHATPGVELVAVDASR